MILRLPEYDFVTVWESTTLSNLTDFDTKRLMKGVQLVPFRDRVNTYQRDIAVRQLENIVFTKANIEKLMMLRKRIAGHPYEEDKIELVRAAYDGPFGHNAEELSSLFCSELVAEAYQTLGLFSETKPSNEYTPADFSKKEKLALLQGRLGEEMLVKSES